ncbi:uncharacterized protein LOC117322367 [Pecten maximus]|uniref:uncharacterized protein LOC117322367 n=1 Tax=Pecten maximus TaxID=6579 RepID=UPI0014588B73|nr:uncharacterized protein LOC117322367 [Pecten maximus]
MTLIEGIGDEVTLLFAVGVIIFIIILAWISTNIQEIPFFSVIIVELTQRRRQRANLGADNEATSSLADNPSSDSTNINSSTEGSSESDEVQTEENPVTESVSSSSDGVGQKSNVTEETEVETTVRFVNVLDNNGIQDSVLHGIRGQHRREEGGDVENEPVPNIQENIVDLEQNLNASQNESQIISDIREDSLSETELRRRRVAFFDQKRNSNVSETRAGYSSDINLTGGDPITSNSSGEQESASTVCDKTSCDSAPSISQEKTPTEEQTGDVSQSEETLRTYTQSEESLHSQSEEVHEATLGEEVSDGDGRIRIRLKYLNDTQRNVVASRTDTVGQFRRVNFATELQDNKVVRFIFNGRDLRSDTMTLDSYNVVDNSVLHCLITQMNREAPPPRVDTEGGFDMGTIMLPLFGVILCIMWYLRFEYRPFFSATSTISLFGITSLYVAAVLASWESHRRGNVHDHID